MSSEGPLIPSVASALRPGISLSKARQIAGEPLPLPHAEPRYPVQHVEAYQLPIYGKMDTVWAYFDADSTLVLLEW